jgi:riboflavin synthase
MFTGIIESVGTVKAITQQGTNMSFWIESPISDLFKIDQSVAHSGVCLTVEKIENGQHQVTAIEETIKKTNLKYWDIGTAINIERCVMANSRFDGHFVQGHVDTTAICTSKADKNGSWEFEFEFDTQFAPLIIEKGSISLNGISLTIFNIGTNRFTVGIIPYTYEHTNIHQVEIGTIVNIEFDVIGKYLQRSIQVKQ